MADQEDQGLTQADIDAALATAEGAPANASLASSENGGTASVAQGDPDAPPAAGGSGDSNADASTQSPNKDSPDETSESVDPAVGLTQADIDAALAGTTTAASAVEEATQAEASPSAGSPADSRLDSTGKPFDEVAAAMAAEIEQAATTESAADAAAGEPLQLPSLEDPDAQTSGLTHDIELLDDVELSVTVELGRAEKTVEEVLSLDTGSVVELDRLAGDPVDILVNERLVARGEVLVLNENLCIRISEIVNHHTEPDAV